ncbi:MAG: phosphoribosylformylglycinamidine synthase subunit PurL [Euryarchaeota archaeon]|nr:phosphoribosylformylglycinamidine synthase subunit PurL [Euryarchaeota archaeon]
MPLREASDEELAEISERRQLALNLEEMRAIQRYYRRLGREPTDVELETFAQTWSEHCVHKTFKGVISYEGEEIDGLLRSTIARVTRELSPEWCFSVFEDNAGIVDFEGDYAIAFKVETHNHPSAIEPFGGAATGVGGVIRDVLGVWGEPIANTDVLCFGPLDYPYEKLPRDVKHPRFIFTYVVAGIGSYGNNIGVPTVNGAIYFDEGYVGNPLVYCGTLGIVKKSKYKRSARPGDVLLLVGGRTGRDGIHGVTFASSELEEGAEETFGTAVQIGDPIEEEKIKRAILQVREEELGSAITDLGGGGLSSAVGEQAHRFGCGARVHLERVPLKYAGMKPWEIWISESQERMLLIVPPSNLERVLEIFAGEEVEATPIGELIPEPRLEVYYRGEKVAELDMDFLFSGLPRVKREARWSPPELEEPEFEMRDLGEELHRLLAMPNIASKEEVIRTYDHEVKAMTVLKPLQGVAWDGPGDAAVLKPLRNSWRGIAVSCGMNPLYGKIDPYWMAASAIDEAIRNNIAVGGRRIALLDNFCWGNPEKPENLGGLVRAAKACYDIALAYGTPFISGKDSLYNESPLGAVTPSLLISALGIVEDVRRAVSMDFKERGNYIYLLGETKPELGGSHYYKLRGFLGTSVPGVEPSRARRTFEALTRAIDLGLVKACHDLSEGGLGVALAEMCFSGGVGAELCLEAVPVSQEMRADFILFSESNSRFLVEVEPENAGQFEALMKHVRFARVGETSGGELVVSYRGEELLREDIGELKRSWQRGVAL